MTAVAVGLEIRSIPQCVRHSPFRVGSTGGYGRYAVRTIAPYLIDRKHGEVLDVGVILDRVAHNVVHVVRSFPPEHTYHNGR